LAASEVKVGVVVVDEASAKINPGGHTVSPGDQLASGEMYVVGDIDSVRNLATARVAEGGAYKHNYENITGRAGLPPDLKAMGLDAAMAIYKGTHDMKPPAGTVSNKHAVNTTFVHGSAHVDPSSGAIRPEGSVFMIILQGTASQW